MPDREGSGKRGGKGSHGSTTKAGKVRMQTPKILPTVKHKHNSPRVSKRKAFRKQFILKRKVGQNRERQR